MKRFLMLTALLAVAAVLAVTSGVQADPAVVIKNSGLCGMPGADANGNIIFGGLGLVTTNLGNDNWAKIDCKGTGITNLSGKAQHFSGFLCGLSDPQGGGFFLTSDSHATVAKNGNATLTCRFDKTP